MDEFGKRPARRRVYDGVMKGLVLLGAGLTIALLVALIGYILVRGLPHVTWQLLSTSPSMMKGTIGILPNILNTLYLILFTLLISLPLGVGAAVYLTEYAKNRRFAEMVEFATETLAGIPSILYGLVGMLFFCQMLGFKTSLLSGGCTLVVMILPTIHPHHAGIAENRAAKLPRGRAGAWRLEMAYDSHHCAALFAGRHRHGLHPFRGAHCGRIGRAAVHGGRGHRGGLEYLRGVHPLGRQPQRSAVYVCVRARRV